MQRVNFFHGQTVTETELDAVFDYAEDAERNMAIDTGHAQVDDGATPGPTVYGGILAGLVVTGVAGENHVHVSLGVAKDDQGRRINLSAAASVLLSNIGLTTAGDVTDAQGTGAATTSIAAGAYSVLSLWIEYVETLSNPRVDLLGATVQYDIAEDFQFELQLGDAAGYNHANVVAGLATPNRSAILDDKVLLADIIVFNNAGTVQVAAVAPPVCTKDEDWDDLLGNYANLTGRRSDWIACDQGTDFPQFAAQSLELRQPTAREAIYDLTKKLQARTASDGASLIGAKTIVGAHSVSSVQPLATPRGLTASSVGAGLLEIINELNGKSQRGADLMHPLTDDFMRCSKAAFNVWDPDSENPQIWGLYATGGGGGLTVEGGPSGVVRCTTVAVPGSMVGIQSGYTSVGGASSRYWWSAVDTYLFPVAGIRFKIPAITACTVAFMFVSSGSAYGYLSINCTGPMPVCNLIIQDTAAGGPWTSPALGYTIPANTWLEMWVGLEDTQTIAVNSVYDGTSDTFSFPGAQTFGANPFAFRASVSGTSQDLDIDTISISDRVASPNVTAGLFGRPVG